MRTKHGFDTGKKIECCNTENMFQWMKEKKTRRNNTMNAAQIILLIASDEGQHEHAPIHTHRHILCFFIFLFRLVFFVVFSCRSFLLALSSMVTLVLKLIAKQFCCGKTEPKNWRFPARRKGSFIRIHLDHYMVQLTSFRRAHYILTCDFVNASKIPCKQTLWRALRANNL